MKFVRKPATLWLLLALIFLICAIAVKPLAALDLSMHDTYYVFKIRHLLFLLSVLLVVGWALIRFIPLFRTVNWLCFVHVIGTAVSLGIIVAILLQLEIMPQMPVVYRDYSGFEDYPVNTGFSMNELGAIVILLFLLLQLCWIIQPAIALYRTIRKK